MRGAVRRTHILVLLVAGMSSTGCGLAEAYRGKVAETDAARLQRAHRFAEAEAAYRRALDVFPRSASVHYGLARALLGRRRYAAAAAEFARTSTLDPRRAWPHWGLGEASYALGHYDRARAEYMELARRDPGDPEGPARIARAAVASRAKRLLTQGQFAESATAFREALRDDEQVPSDAVHCDLGKALLALGRPSEALVEFRRAAWDQPQAACERPPIATPRPADGRRGLEDHDLVPHDEGEVCRLRAAIEQATSAAAAAVARGMSMLRAGRGSDAAMAFREALTLNVEPAQAHAGLGAALLSLERYDQALVVFEEAMRRDPRLAWAQGGIGYAHLRRGRLQPALAAFRAAVTLDPRDPASLCGVGQALLGLGRSADALAAFKRSLALEPTSWAWWGVGESQARLGRLEESRSAFAEAQRLSQAPPRPTSSDGS
jgi:tetratricopeptide (TPR) repeat protein